MTAEKPFVTGYAFDSNGQYLFHSELARQLEIKIAGSFTKSDLVAFCASLNGLFSFVLHTPQGVFCYSDPSGIYPVFYRTEPVFSFSLSAEALTGSHAGSTSLADTLPETDIDPDARAEYLCTGAPLSGKTLLRGLYTVPAGTLLHIQENGRPSATRVHSWLLPPQGTPGGTAIGILENVSERLAKSLQNRQAVVPLSGGFDSRLILCLLKKAGYKKVLCYTVGPDLKEEQQVAEKVANELGYPVYRIDFNEPEAVRQQFGSKEFMRYVRYMGSFRNFLWLFEYNAILWLQSKKLLDDDAVFIPGHTGDFLGGSQIRKTLIGPKTSPFSWRLKLSLNHFEYGYPLHNRKLQRSLKEFFRRCPKQVSAWLKLQEFVSLNRLPAQINNSARVYAFFGYDVRLPFWDNELTDFFKSRPYSFFTKDLSYQHFLAENIFKPLHVFFPDTDTPKLVPTPHLYRKQLTKNLVKNFLPRRIRVKYRHKNDTVSELALVQEMIRELTENRIMKHSEDYISCNEIMMRWYLFRLETGCF